MENTMNRTAVVEQLMQLQGLLRRQAFRGGRGPHGRPGRPGPAADGRPEPGVPGPGPEGRPGARPDGRGRGPWADRSRGQGRVLALLRLTPEVAQKDLALVLGLTKQAVAEIVAKLEAKGFVEKIASEGDRRQVIVKLTDAGREAAEAAAEERDDAVAGLLEALSDEEVETFSELLGKLITNLEAKLGEDSEERKERIDEFWRHHGHEGHGHGRGRGCGCGGHGGHGGRGRGRCCR